MDGTPAATPSLLDALLRCVAEQGRWVYGDDDTADGAVAGQRRRRRPPAPCPAKYRQLLRSGVQHQHYSAVLHLVDLFACSGVEPPHSVLYATFRADDDACPDAAGPGAGPPGVRSCRAEAEPDVRLWGFVTRALALRKEAAAAAAAPAAPATGRLRVERPGAASGSSTDLDAVVSPPAEKTKAGGRKRKAAVAEEDELRKAAYGVLLLELAADMVEVDLKLSKDDLHCLLVQSLPDGGGSVPLTKLAKTLQTLIGHLRIENTPMAVFTQVQRILQAMTNLTDSNVICDETLFMELAFELKTLPVETFTRFIETIPAATTKVKILDHLLPMICTSSATAKERQEEPSIAKVIRVYFSSAPVNPKSAGCGSASAPQQQRSARAEPLLRMLTALTVLVTALAEIAASEGLLAGDRDALGARRAQFRKLELSVEKSLGESVVLRARCSPCKHRCGQGSSDKGETDAKGDVLTEKFAVLLEILNAAVESLAAMGENN